MKQAILTLAIFALLATTSRTADADDTSTATSIGIGVGVGLFVASPMLMLSHPDKEKLERQSEGLIVAVVGTTSIALGSGIYALARREGKDLPEGDKGIMWRKTAGAGVVGFGLIALSVAQASWEKDWRKPRVSVSAAPTPSGMSFGLAGRF